MGIGVLVFSRELVHVTIFLYGTTREKRSEVLDNCAESDVLTQKKTLCRNGKFNHGVNQKRAAACSIHWVKWGWRADVLLF